MKRSVSLAAAFIALAGLLGAGCASTPTQATQQEQQLPGAKMTGCTPKAILVQEPAVNANVTLPFAVKVQIHNATSPNCHWTVFEGQAGSLTLQDEKGTILGRGILATQEDWMTDQLVNFDGKVFVTPGMTPSGKLTLVIAEDNPSGEKESQTVMIPVNVQ